MKEKNSINLIAIFLYIIILVLISSIIFLGVYIYKEEFRKTVKEVAEADIQQTIITTKLPEDNEVIEVVTITPTTEIVDNSNIENNIDSFYYDQLDEYSRLIYDSLNDQKENLKTGTASISLPNEIGELLKTEEGIKEIEGIFSIAINAFEYDNPDVFYLDASKMALYYESDYLGNCNAYIKNYDENGNYLIEGFNGKEDIDKAENQINAIVNELENNINNLYNQYDKIKFIHDWIVENTKYDETLSKYNRNNIYGLLIEKSATCGGYAKTFKYIMDKLNINSIIVQGQAQQDGNSEYHAWNYVQLDNKWYGIDCTWDDPIVQGISEEEKEIYYDYFLKGQSAFSNHFKFNTFYGTDLKINYPELTLNNY